MTRKDLNLSLDQSLLPPRKAPESTRGTVTGKQGRPSSKKQPAITPPKHRKNWHTTTIAGFAIINMAFLLAAGIWLSTLQHTLAAPIATMITGTVPRIEIMLVDTNDRLDALQRQLYELIVVIDDHQQLTAAVYAEQEDDQTVLVGENVPASKVSAKEIPRAADNWYVNLGTFSSEDAADRVRLQLNSTRQQAQISRYDLPGTTSFELRLAGFEDRESAELAAGEVMENTELNGLTIWKDS